MDGVDKTHTSRWLLKAPARSQLETGRRTQFTSVALSALAVEERKVEREREKRERERENGLQFSSVEALLRAAKGRSPDRYSICHDSRFHSLPARLVAGMYVMVVGIYVIQTSDQPFIKVHKIVDLSSFPDREALWYLEVIEAYKLFYQPSLEE